MELPDIRNVQDIYGKRVLVRAGLNVPIKDGAVRNDFRIRKALDTLFWLREQGAKTILISHIGRDSKNTLAPVESALKAHIPVRFVSDIIGAQAQTAVSELKNGEILLLENLRKHLEEQKNDQEFAKKLAGLGEIYVNDAFSVAHRKHASIVGVPQYLPHYAGILFVTEVAELSRAAKPEAPAFLIIGGAKFETKKPLIRKYLSVYDKIFVCGAVANDFFKAKGYEVGKSLVSENIEDIEELLDNGKILLPVDIVVQTVEGVVVKSPGEVEKDDVIVDAGPKTMEFVREEIEKSKFVLWNGPLGNYELGHKENTELLARMIAQRGVPAVVGGGDTIAAISGLSLENKFTFISTGGGAMLEFLIEGTLPAIEVLTVPVDSYIC
jgi:phosphoglycerate kinase